MSPYIELSTVDCIARYMLYHSVRLLVRQTRRLSLSLVEDILYTVDFSRQRSR